MLPNVNSMLKAPGIKYCEISECSRDFVLLKLRRKQDIKKMTGVFRKKKRIIDWQIDCHLAHRNMTY